MTNLRELFSHRDENNEPGGLIEERERGVLASNSLENIASRLAELQQDLEAHWVKVSKRLGQLPANNRESARNLVHYLALRSHDIRDLQNDLARHGISSLGRSEGHVMSNLNGILRLLHRASGRSPDPPICERVLDFDDGARLLTSRTDALLGPPPGKRKVRIMVTMPGEAADDPALVESLVRGGMEVARVNCAHDDEEVWGSIVDKVHRACESTERNCKVFIDLAGPKLRTGAFEPGPQVLKIQPVRNPLGHVLEPVRVRLASPETDNGPPDGAFDLRLPKSFVSRVEVGDELEFEDARGSRRRLSVVGEAEGGFWLIGKKTAYIVPETRFSIAGKHRRHDSPVATPRNLSALESSALLHKGDRLTLTRPEIAGRPGKVAADGKAAMIASCRFLPWASAWLSASTSFRSVAASAGCRKISPASGASLVRPA